MTDVALGYAGKTIGLDPVAIAAPGCLRCGRQADWATVQYNPITRNYEALIKCHGLTFLQETSEMVFKELISMGQFPVAQVGKDREFNELSQRERFQHHLKRALSIT